MKGVAMPNATYTPSSMRTLSGQTEQTGNPVIRDIIYNIAEPAKAHLRAFAGSKYLKLVKKGVGLDEAKHVVIVTVYNEYERLEFFLSYYRLRGFDGFIFINNMSTDGTRDFLVKQDDVTLYDCAGSYKNSRYGVDWVNCLLSRHCHDKWILFVDADEFFCFDSDHGAAPLAARLEAVGKPSLQSLLLDMYADKPVEEVHVPSGSDPLQFCPYFDSSGYYISRELASNTSWIKGGVRQRVFFDQIHDGPALNKTPFVKWKRHFAFLKSAHECWPPRINGEGQIPESALLHYKFVSNSSIVKNSTISDQHTSEYKAYTDVRETRSFVNAGSVTYVDPRQLVDLGIIASLRLLPVSEAVTESDRTAASQPVA